MGKNYKFPIKVKKNVDPDHSLTFWKCQNFGIFIQTMPGKKEGILLTGVITR